MVLVSLDVGVVCPGTQRYVDQGSGTARTTPVKPADADDHRDRPS